MDLQRLPDDWLQDVLVFHDFTTRWRLRRCCRLYRYLLLSKFTNRTIILSSIRHFYDTRETVQRYHDIKSAILTVLPYLRNLIIRGPIVIPKRITVVELGLLCMRHVENLTRPLHLIFVNVPNWMSCLEESLLPWSEAKLADLTLINVPIKFSTFWHHMRLYVISPGIESRLGYLCVNLSELRLTEVFHVPYFCCEPCAGQDTDNFCLPYSRMLLDLLPSLGASSLHALRDAETGDRAIQLDLLYKFDLDRRKS